MRACRPQWMSIPYIVITTSVNLLQRWTLSLPLPDMENTVFIPNSKGRKWHFDSRTKGSSRVVSEWYFIKELSGSNGALILKATFQSCIDGLLQVNCIKRLYLYVRF